MMDDEDMSDIDYHLEWRKVQLRSHLTPPLKANSASVSLGEDIYMFGGQGSGQFREVWKFCSKTQSWSEVVCTSAELGDIPNARDGHTMVKISDTKLVIYAGQGGLFDSGKCERATEHGKVKYLSMRKLFDDMFELDVSTLQWKSMPRRKVRPLGRRGHTMTYVKPSLCCKRADALGNVLVFGGSCLDTSTGFEKVSNDVWTFSLSDKQWTEVECSGVRPRAVYGHSGVLVEDSYIIIGGSYAPPKKEGFLSKAKALAPKKKVVQTYSSAISESAESSIISVLNVATFQWSILNIDCVPYDLDTPPPYLNITGHTTMGNPLNVREVLIFGGRAVETDNNHFSDFSSVEDDPSFVAANLFTLNIDDCTLKRVDVKNDAYDSANVPEARLNHMCQRYIDGHIVLNYNREDAKTKKMKNGRRIFDITAKKKEILAQTVTLVYGGFKANSPGFCDCSVYELRFIPDPNKKKADIDGEVKFATPEENTNDSYIGFVDDASHVSRLSLEASEFDDRSNKIERGFRSFDYESQCSSTGSLRALKLKSDSSTQLLSPKRGVDGRYFDIKSALSYSKSTFIPSSSKIKSSPECDQSSIDVLSKTEDEENDVKSLPSKGGTVLTAERMLFMSSKEIMKTRTKEIAPKTKGMTVHNARSVYNRLYRLPGLPSSMTKKAKSLK